MPLPNRDDRHLARLRDHFAQFGAIPSYAGIGELAGFKGKTGAVKLAQRLIEGGFLRRAPGGKLAPTPRFFELPRFEAPVRAGLPVKIDAAEVDDSITLGSYLVDTPSRTVLVRVKGDSMRDAGVLEGDLAIVERARDAHQGEIVVAVVDGEFTLKEIRFESGRPILISHNANYPPIRPSQSFEVFGVVRSLVRRYAAAGDTGKRTVHGASV